MKELYRQYILLLLIIACPHGVFSQSSNSPIQLKLSGYSSKDNQNNFSAFYKHSSFHKHSAYLKHSPPEKENKTQSVLPLSIGVLAAVYIINPIVEYTEKKV